MLTQHGLRVSATALRVSHLISKQAQEPALRYCLSCGCLLVSAKSFILVLLMSTQCSNVKEF